MKLANLREAVITNGTASPIVSSQTVIADAGITHVYLVSEVRGCYTPYSVQCAQTYITITTTIAGK